MQASPDHYNQETERGVKRVARSKKKEERSQKKGTGRLMQKIATMQ